MSGFFVILYLNGTALCYVMMWSYTDYPPVKGQFGHPACKVTLVRWWKMEVVMTTGATRRAKLQSNHHHQHSTFYRPDNLLLPNQQCQSTERNI